MAHKIKMAVAEYGIPEEQASKRILEIETSRKEHYLQYTGTTWGEAQNYNASFDTGIFTLEQIADIVKKIIPIVNKNQFL